MPKGEDRDPKSEEPESRPTVNLFELCEGTARLFGEVGGFPF